MKRAIIKIFIQLPYIKSSKNLLIHECGNNSFSQQKCIVIFIHF